MVTQTAEFRRRLIKLILPITFQQIMLGLVSASDALMLGALTQDALSAVSLAGQVSFVENMFLFGLTAGRCSGPCTTSTKTTGPRPRRTP